MAKSKTTEESGNPGGEKGAGGSAQGKAAGRTSARSGTSASRASANKSADNQPPKKSAARKAPAKKAAAAKLTGGLSPAGTSGGKAPNLKKHLKDFASGRPQGWTHDDWESFLGHLRNQGHDTSNADAIGLALERERLSLALQQVEGLGPRRIKNLAERYTTVWSLRHADVEEIAEVANVRRDLAERIKSAV